MGNLLNGFHDVVLYSLLHVHYTPYVLVLVVAVYCTAENQLKHPTEFPLVAAFRYSINIQ